MTLSVTVVAAFESAAKIKTGTGKARVVFETDAGEIGLAEGRIDRGEEGSALFAPISLAQMRATAERAICGDPAVIAHPKTILVLATALVAVLETLCRQEKTDG